MKLGPIEKLTILLEASYAQGAQIKDNKIRHQMKMIFNRWWTESRRLSKQLNEAIGPDGQEKIEDWGAFYLDVLDLFVAAENKDELYAVAQTYLDGGVEYTDQDLQTTCLRFLEFAQRNPGKDPQDLWAAFDIKLKAEYEQQVSKTSPGLQRTDERKKRKANRKGNEDRAHDGPGPDPGRDQQETGQQRSGPGFEETRPGDETAEAAGGAEIKDHRELEIENGPKDN